jgi:hypothetical protein
MINFQFTIKFYRKDKQEFASQDFGQNEKNKCEILNDVV